jgi:NitT/TauT family transport system permease protein
MGSVIGFLFGVIIAEFSLISKISLPYLIASNAIPVIAIAPMIILWFGYGIMAKVIVSAFVCFFPLVITTYKGLNEYKIVFAELFKIYGSNKYEFLIKYKLPNAIPFILSGLKLNATYSVVGAVVAEFIGANSGLGFGMLQSIYSMNTARLWGYIAISCSLGMMMYFFVYVFEITINKFMRYEKII